MQKAVSVFWFRRDLRLDDNAALYHALKSGHPVMPIFIFDRHILDDLTNKKDARVTFIHQALSGLKAQLEELGSSLWVFNGKPEQVWQQLIATVPIAGVYTNHDFEPYAMQRDQQVASMLANKAIPFHTYKDHVIFQKEEVVKTDGLPYTVFTPYSRKWLEKLKSRMSSYADESGNTQEISFYLKPYPNSHYFGHLAPREQVSLASELPSLASLGFEPTDIDFPPTAVTRGLIRNYDKTRDIPSIAGTSKLGIHFRFGTISIREKARHALELNATYLNELIWRDFYS
ncbi:MAG TPA: deoxyribodipyrimidine photo-lyase, partial [Saprospiraceae bacterium]|nr:deoxyribodipyrimidine photo-lyase [Saprospiraceae bacterium]